MAFSTARTTCNALHTDLANMDAYTDRPALMAELVLAAEEKLNAIASHVAEVRASLAMRGTATIVDMRRVG